MKGSDASWADNNEPPECYLEYSDDEQERIARRNRRAANNPDMETETEVKKTNSLERNKKFERHMNNKNTLMNQRFNPPSTSSKKFEEQGVKMSSNWNMPPPRPVRPDFCLPYGYFNQYGNYPMMPQFGLPPVFQPFNPHIPPPNQRMPHLQHNLHLSNTNPHNPHLVTNNPHMPVTNPHLVPSLMRPQPVPYFPNPRHPRWGPPGPPNTYGNGTNK